MADDKKSAVRIVLNRTETRGLYLPSVEFDNKEVWKGKIARDRAAAEAEARSQFDASLAGSVAIDERGFEPAKGPTK